MRRAIAGIVAAAVCMACDGSGFGITGVASSNIPATRLRFSVQPSNVAPATNISPAVRVQVLNSNGAPATNSSAAVTLQITPGTGTAGAVLSGTTTVNAMDGIAAFTALRIDRAGNGYSLTATSQGLTSAISQTFNVQ